MKRPLLYIVFAILVSTGSVPSTQADWKADIGWNQLFAEKGASLENGAGIVVSMAEAPVGGNYMPNVGGGQYTGKTIVNGSGGSSGVSGHANGVAQIFFGNTLSIAPGVTHITVYNANDWINNQLNTASGGDPVPLPFKVQNHSWISLGTSGIDNVSRRIDFVINQHQTTMVGGVNNGTGSNFPTLLASAYNAINVGRSDGDHSTGTTTVYGPGRNRPDIVAPGTTTSQATPMVSSTAALLHQKALGTDAGRADVMRAVILSGATKHQFPGWSRTQLQPMDTVYGAGQVNVYNSYKILEGGPFTGSTSSGSSPVGWRGWDYRASIVSGQDVYYEFVVPHNGIVTDFSVTLTWNMIITDTHPDPNIFAPIEFLGNLDMRFYDSTGAWLGNQLDASLATVGNIEHLYFSSLGPGHYTLRVSSDVSRDFALAWHGTLTIPEPAVGLLISALLSLFALKRGRRTR
ncbi:MAG TPA: hypothetical protein PKD54_04825 [Pirellulaceae bacterium]|nr:hypothetical protein [Pirellulaceae bacterium]